MIPLCVMGIDISKNRLDVFTDSPEQAWACGNDASGIGRVISRARECQAFVVFEATSVCDRALRRALSEAGIAFARVNPGRARSFARAAGYLAKTDQVDARMLADMGRRMNLKAGGSPSAERQTLADLLGRREQLVEMRKQEKVRLLQTDMAAIRADLASHIRVLDGRIDKIENALRALVGEHEELQEAFRRLSSAPGVGPITALTLLAHLPELGACDRRAIAALAGLAPLASDSGLKRGQRRIWGGRRTVRRALYLAANAARQTPAFKAYYQRLVDKGKAPKTAIIALARKLLVILNAMTRDSVSFASQQT